MTAYQLPSPPTQQPVSQLPYKEMAKTNTNQMTTPKESLVNKLPDMSTVTTNGQPIQVSSNATVNGTLTKKKSGYLYSHPLKIDTSVASKTTPISPTSQSNSPLPTSTSTVSTTTTTTTTTTGSSPRPKSSNNNTFVHKLYQMLSDPKHSNYIKWNDTGLSFTIRNVKVFSRTVLPLHFRHNNFSSFVRQLNMYGFHKVNKSSPNTKGSENQVWEFFHPKFIRGKPQLIEEIKRKQIENENYRANLYLEQSRVLARHNSTLSNRNSATFSNAVTTAPVTVATQLVPSQGITVNSQMTTADVSGPQPVLMKSPEGIPAATNVTVAVTSSGETVLIDPTSIQNNTPPLGNFGVIQIPSQNIPYNEVSSTVTTPVTATPMAQPMTMGEMIPQNQPAMVEPANVVVNSHPMVPPEVPSITSTPIQMDNDVLYNIQLLQLQNQDMNQRLNEMQANVNNFMNTYTRRMDMQQNLIQQLMKGQNNVPTVCSVDQGQALAATSFDMNNQVMPQGTIVNGTIVTQSPINHQQIIQPSPMVVQPNSFPQQHSATANSQDQKLMNQNHTTPVMKPETIFNNHMANGVAYPAQTIYY